MISIKRYFMQHDPYIEALDAFSKNYKGKEGVCLSASEGI